MTAMVVETLCYTVIIGYNVNHYYAISTYGDVFACWVQNLIICGLLGWYRRPTQLQMTVGAIAFLTFNWWIISGYCGMRALVAMQVCTNHGLLDPAWMFKVAGRHDKLLHGAARMTGPIHLPLG